MKKEECDDTFEQLKTKATVVAVSGTWLQWKSHQGATFYTQGHSGGQWDCPSEFINTSSSAPLKQKTPIEARDTMSLSKGMRENIEVEKKDKIQINDTEKHEEETKANRRKSGGLHEHGDLSDLNTNLMLMDDMRSSSTLPLKTTKLEEPISYESNQQATIDMNRSKNDGTSSIPKAGEDMHWENQTSQSLIQESLSQNNVSKTSAIVPATDDSVYSDLYEVDASHSRGESQKLLGSKN